MFCFLLPIVVIYCMVAGIGTHHWSAKVAAIFAICLTPLYVNPKFDVAYLQIVVVTTAVYVPLLTFYLKQIIKNQPYIGLNPGVIGEVLAGQGPEPEPESVEMRNSRVQWAFDLVGNGCVYAFFLTTPTDFLRAG